MPSTETPPKSSNTAFWLGFVVVIVILGLITAYAGLMGMRQLAQQLPEKPVVSFIIQGKSYGVSGQDAQQLVPQLAGFLAQQQAESGQTIEADINRLADAAFQPALEAIPHFMDWYYSLPGEYSRYAAALGEAIGGAGMAVYMENKLHETVIAPAELEQALDGLSGVLSASLTQEMEKSRAVALEHLAALLQSRQIPPSPDYQIKVNAQHDLSAVLSAHFRVDAADLTRTALAGAAAVGVGGAAAKGLGGVVVKKTVAKAVGGGTFKAATALLSKFAVKMAVKGGGAGTAAVAGVALCSPGGPLAAACGLVAGVATWLLVDEVFILFDQAINREQFEAEIRQAIESEREALKAQLKHASQQWLEQQYAELARQFSVNLQRKIGDDFIPAQSR